MSHSIRFQALVLPNAPWQALLKRIHKVEALGFDVLATADHFVDWSNPSSDWLELPTLLGAMTRETSTISLASFVAQIPLRDPATMARQALGLDQMSGGRFELGLGIGLVSDPSCESMGLPVWSNKERVARFKEYLEVVDRLLSNELSSYDGEYYRIKDAYMNPRPNAKPRPPITVAAMGPKMLKLAATYADNWNSMSFCETFGEQLAETAERIEKVRAHCEAIGRDPSTLRMSYSMFDPGARTRGGRFDYYESDEVFVDIVKRVHALGVTEFSLYYPMQDAQMPGFERVARELIPRLRDELEA